MNNAYKLLNDHDEHIIVVVQQSLGMKNIENQLVIVYPVWSIGWNACGNDNAITRMTEKTELNKILPETKRWSVYLYNFNYTATNYGLVLCCVCWVLFVHCSGACSLYVLLSARIVVETVKLFWTYTVDKEVQLWWGQYRIYGSEFPHCYGLWRRNEWLKAPKCVLMLW